MKCRHCGVELRLPFVDLGMAPPSNAYRTREQLHDPEKWYPLRVLVCESCWLVQTEDYVRAGELFTDDYAYFSSVSTTWLDHARNYVAAMSERSISDPTVSSPRSPPTTATCCNMCVKAGSRVTALSRQKAQHRLHGKKDFTSSKNFLA